MASRKYLLLILLLGVGLLSACKDRAAGPAAAGRGLARAPQVVEVTPVERRDLSETINLIGSLQANESAEIRPEVGGLVREIFFGEGQRVEAGDVLLKIDDAELQAQVAQIEARYRLAELNVARSENLSETRTIPQSEFDRARSEFAATKAELEVLRLRLGKTAVKAPFAGIVGARAISPGDFVSTSTVITRLDDLTRMKLSFQVPERFLAKVHPGTQLRAIIRLAGNERRERVVQGEVYFVSATIDRSIRASEVKAMLGEADPALRPGMFANVELILDVRQQVLTVPEGAILADARGVQIIVADEKDGQPVARYVPVRTGLRARGLVEVTPMVDDLPENVPVVASGVGALVLYPGAPIDPKPLRARFSVAP